MTSPTATPPLPADAAALATIFCFHDLFGPTAGFQKVPYTYVTTVSAVARGHSVGSLRIHADARFHAYMTMAVGYNAERCMVTYRNDHTDRQHMNDPVPIQMLGSIAHPLLLPTPLVLASNTTVSIGVFNEGDQEAHITFALIGFKSFAQSPRTKPIIQRPDLSHRGLERLKAFLDAMAEEM